MERTQVLELMGTLKLYGMCSADDHPFSRPHRKSRSISTSGSN
jgi:hypothetical protein